MSNLVTLKDKKFKPYITSEQIHEAVKGVAKKINSDLENDFPIFLVVLNGSFVFAADLLREVNIPCEISFIKLASYIGTTSSGTVHELIGLNENLKNRTVVIIEDIVDSGVTVEKLMQALADRNTKAVKIVTALFKPDAYKKQYTIDYVGLEIKNEFVVGYGLDYDGLGRNLKDIYVLAE